jgi:transposase
MDYEGIKTLLRKAHEQFPRLSHLWLDAGYRGEDKGKDWVQKTLGWTVELVERPRKAAPKEVLMAWAQEWAKEGVKADWKKLLPPKGFQVLPRRWVVERTIAWIDQNRRMSLGTTRGRVRAGKRSPRVCCHDSPHDEAARPCLRTFHTASPRTPVNKRWFSSAVVVARRKAGLRSRLSSPPSSRAPRSSPLRRHSTPSARRRSATERLRRGSPCR